MALVLVYENEGVTWLSSTQLLGSWTYTKLVIIIHLHPSWPDTCAEHLAVSQSDTELTFHSLIAWQLAPMAYYAYMGAASFTNKPLASRL